VSVRPARRASGRRGRPAPFAAGAANPEHRAWRESWRESACGTWRARASPSSRRRRLRGSPPWYPRAMGRPERRRARTSHRFPANRSGSADRNLACFFSRWRAPSRRDRSRASRSSP